MTRRATGGAGRRGLAVLLGGLAACRPALDEPEPAPPPADLLLTGARIWTADPDRPWAEAMAVTDGAIAWIGDDADAGAHRGPGTRIVDAAGRLVLPGLHDVHVHPLEAGSEIVTCILDPWASAQQLVPTLADCADDWTPTDWILGWGHSVYALLEATRAPRDILDEAIPDRPAAMLDWTAHSLWVNSAGLAAGGIDATTPDPPGGVIVRDPATGEPTGLLFDNAGDVLLDAILAPTPLLDEMHYDGLAWSLGQVARHGITSIADARVNLARNHDVVWRRVQEEGLLPVRATLGILVHPEADDDAQIARIAALYDDEPGALLRVTQAKIFADGLTSNTTAAMLEPYLYDLGVADGRGLLFFEPDRFARYVAELEPLGFDVHVHAIGDRAVRASLDAVEAAIAANGAVLDRRHRITHAELIHPDDVPRFAALGVVADLQTAGDWVLPEEAYAEAWLLGEERIDAEWFRLRDLYESGARVVLSSDWDVSTLSPFPRLQHAIARGDQSLPSLGAALRAATIDSAWVLRQEALTGSLQVGKRADFVVVDRDLFEIDVSEIGGASALLTVLDGQETWRDPSFDG